MSNVLFTEEKAVLHRIKNPLPKPTHCHNCGSDQIGLCTNKVIYGKDYGDWPLVWYCYHCRAAVGCHPKTEIPTGFMADSETRRARATVHSHFDPLWKNTKPRMRRSEAYAWLAQQMELHVCVCHISYFDIPMCQKATDILKRYWKGKIE